MVMEKHSETKQPQTDLSNADSDVDARTQARSEVEIEALTRLRRRYDMLNDLTVQYLQDTGWFPPGADFTVISAEQALRAAEMAALLEKARIASLPKGHT